MSDLHHFYILPMMIADVIVGKESWLNNDVTDDLFDPNGEYFIFRRDRVSVCGGGGGCAVVRNTSILCQASCDSLTECFDVFSASIPYRYFSHVHDDVRCHNYMSDVIKCLESHINTTPKVPLS